MADGCEEIEGLTVVDIARRAGIEIDTISITGKPVVTSSHKVTFETDTTKEEADFASYDGIVLPGGMPGTLHLKEHAGLDSLIRSSAEDGIYLAAICAAPTVYGEKGLLTGKRAACYPGMESGLVGAEVCYDSVVTDGTFITSRGMGTAIDFALALTEILKGKEQADTIARQIVYDR